MKFIVIMLLAVLSSCLAANHFLPGVIKTRASRKLREAVIFHVDYRGPKITGQVGHNVRIPYSHVNMNIGGGYNVGLHAFLAPRDGVYMFNVDGLSGHPGNGCIELRHNNYIVDGGYTSKYHDTMTMSRPLRLKKGDSVFVVICRHHVHTINGEYRNSFAGFLLTEL